MNCVHAQGFTCRPVMFHTPASKSVRARRFHTSEKCRRSSRAHTRVQSPFCTPRLYSVIVPYAPVIYSGTDLGPQITISVGAQRNERFSERDRFFSVQKCKSSDCPVRKRVSCDLQNSSDSFYFPVQGLSCEHVFWVGRADPNPHT